jgi:hypothetical protein
MCFISAFLSAIPYVQINISPLSIRPVYTNIVCMRHVSSASDTARLFILSAKEKHLNMLENLTNEQCDDRRALRVDPTCLMARMQLDVVRTLRSASGESENMRGMQTRAQKQQQESGKRITQQNDVEPSKSSVHTPFVGADRKEGRENANRGPSPAPFLDSVSGSSRDATTQASVAPTQIPPEYGALSNSNYARNAASPLQKQQRQQQQAIASDSIRVDASTVATSRQGQTVCGRPGPGADSENDTLEKAVKLFKERTEQGDAPEDCPTDINVMVKDKRWNIRAHGYDTLAYLLTTDASRIDGIDLVDVVSKGLADINAPAQVQLSTQADRSHVSSWSRSVDFLRLLRPICILV